jgi:hypothetical protein
MKTEPFRKIARAQYFAPLSLLRRGLGGGLLLLLAACSEDVDTPGLPEVIGVEDTGLSEKVTISKGDKGTTLSYESWIKVKTAAMQTRATKSGTSYYPDASGKITVPVQNVFAHVSDELYLDRIGIGEVSTKNEFEQIGTPRPNGYITIIDSVMYHVIEADNFRYRWPMTFQVPVYNDGLHKQVMPYYRPQRVEKKGEPRVTNLDTTTNEGKIYSRRLFVYTAEIECAGEVHDIVLSLTLNTKISDGGIYVNGSQVLDEELKVENQDVVSWMKIKQNWSDNTSNNKEYSVILLADIRAQERTSKIVSGTSFTKLGVDKKDISREFVRSIDNYLSVYRYQREYTVHFNHFDVLFDIWQDVPLYDDSFTQHTMPTFDIGDFEIEHWIEGGDEQEHEGKIYYRYDFYCKVIVSLGAERTEIVMIPVYVLK